MESKITWHIICKEERSEFDSVEWSFQGGLCGYEISMYQAMMVGEVFWEALVRDKRHPRNRWSSGACGTREEAESRLEIGLLLYLVCKITGYYRSSKQHPLTHPRSDGTGLI